MKSFLLLLLSLMTGCEASSEVKACALGWVEFIYKYPKTDKIYDSVHVLTPGQTLQSTEKDKWENNGRFSLYHDSKNKNLRVAIQQLERKDFGEYKCKFDPDSNSSDEDDGEVELDPDKDCQTPFTHTAYRTAKTTITCDYPEKKANSIVKFFCKESGSVCEDVLSTKSSLKSNGTFTLTETISGFKMSISNVSSQHAGVYWCGVESKEGSYRAALRKIQLEVEDITILTSSLTTGQTFTYQCMYSDGPPVKKILCKGEDPSICEPLVSTNANKNTGRFSIRDNKNGSITITMREVKTEDSGTYWCGAESKTDKSKSNPFFHKLVMTVGVTLGFGGGSWLSVIIPVVICVALLVLILVLIYKRLQRSKDTRKAEAQNNEDPAYEEIQEHPQKPGSGTTLKSIYATANAPTNPSASQYYSTINFNNSSGEVSGDTYSTVKDNQQLPTYSTVNHPSRLPEDPLYSTVNNPQQH